MLNAIAFLNKLGGNATLTVSQDEIKIEVDYTYLENNEKIFNAVSRIMSIGLALIETKEWYLIESGNHKKGFKLELAMTEHGKKMMKNRDYDNMARYL